MYFSVRVTQGNLNIYIIIYCRVSPSELFQLVGNDLFFPLQQNSSFYGNLQTFLVPICLPLAFWQVSPFLSSSQECLSGFFHSLPVCLEGKKDGRTKKVLEKNSCRKGERSWNWAKKEGFLQPQIFFSCNFWSKKALTDDFFFFTTVSLLTSEEVVPYLETS